MKRFLGALFASIGLLVATASGQVSQVVPQSQQAKIFNAVTTAQTSGCLQNQGQNVWFSNYILSGGTPTVIQYRLEYSYNSDAATCTTGTWFQMSDDATDLSQAEVIGIGAYPFVRANLVQCVGCGAGVTLTSFYSTTSASPGSLNGFYNPSQQTRKIAFANQPATATATSSSIAAPYGSTAGTLLVIAPGGTGFGTSTLQATASYGNATSNYTGSLPLTNLTGTNAYVLPMPPSPATSITLTYTAIGATAGNFSIYYFFTPPGSGLSASAQPPLVNNREVTATAASASVNFSGTQSQNVYIFSVSARCSAGTAGLTITDAINAKTFWSSGTAEVGTTTFKYQWNPGLLANVVSGDTVSVTLTSCGVGNVGTLDVQESAF